MACPQRGRRAVARVAQVAGVVSALLGASFMIPVAMLVMPRAALAHDNLTAMDPFPGSLNAQLPPTVSLTFEETVATVGAHVVVVAPSGEAVSSDDLTVAANRVSVVIKPGTASQHGSYAVHYRIISVDGHEVQGSEAFRVGGEGPVAPLAAGGTDAGSDNSLGYLAVGVGGMLSLGVIGQAVRRRFASRHPSEHEEF